MSETKKPKPLSLPPKPAADPAARAKPRLRSGVTRSTARRSRPGESAVPPAPIAPRTSPVEGFAARGKPRATGSGSDRKKESVDSTGKSTRARPPAGGNRSSQPRTAEEAARVTRPRGKPASGKFARAAGTEGQEKFSRTRSAEERPPFARGPKAETPRKFTRSRPVEGGGRSGSSRTVAEAHRTEKSAKGPPRTAGRVTGDARASSEASQRSFPPPSSQRKSPDDGKVRVSKLLSERGLCSRREADEFIERGWVRVDGQVITELGTRVRPDQAVTLDRKAQAAQLRSVTFLLNKPVGYVSGQPEPGKKPAMALLVPDNRWDEDPWGQRFEPFHLRGLAPAGRLDIDSTGLIVFTQDGRVARRLIGEDSNVEKEYLVRVEGQIKENGLKLLNHGLSLDGERLKPAKVSWQNEDQLRFVLREGKKRQIRRMCEMVGLTVVGLKRIRIGSVLLGKLPAGKWRYLRDDERF